MKYKNLLKLSSIFMSNAGSLDGMLPDVKKLGSTNASSGRLEVGYKGMFYPNLLLVCGFDTTFNPFFGLGYIQTLEYMGWPIEFKFVLYCFDWANKSFSKDYFSKMPISVSASTNIWGFNFGAAVSCSLNKKFLISAFIKFNLNDDYDVSINYHAYGESDFFSKNVYSRSAIEKLKKDSQTIVSGFEKFCRKENVPGEVQDEIIQCFVQHAKQTVRLCSYFLDNKGNLKSIEEAQSKSLLLIGKSGAGKTYTYDLFKKFVNDNKLYSISLITLNASTFTPEGYKGDNVNEKISILFNENIKNSKNYKHSAVSIFRSIILVDEIDNISERNGGSDSDNFYTRVQKAMLDFVEGKQFYKTDVGLIPVLGCLKILPGAFESRSGELERKVIKNIICEKDCLLTSKLIKSLINYIKINYVIEYSDCESYFNRLIDASQNVDELITQELNKDLNFKAFKRGDKDKELKSVDEIYKFLESNKVFSSLKNPGVYDEIKKFSELVKGLKDTLKNIKTTKTGIAFSIDPAKFDDLYVRILDNLEAFSSNLEEKPNEILEVAVENHKRKNALFCISESGMGGEIIRRAAQVYYLEKPSFLRSFKYLENSEYFELLNKNRNNIIYLGHNSDDGAYGCLKALLQSERGGKANNNEKFSFSDLQALCKQGVQDFNYAFAVNGKVIISIKQNGVYYRPNESNDDITIEKVKNLLNEKQKNLDSEIEKQKEDLKRLHKISPVEKYDEISDVIKSENIEESIQNLQEILKLYRDDFLKNQQLKSFFGSVWTINKEENSFDEVERTSKLKKLLEDSSDFFHNLDFKFQIDPNDSVQDTISNLRAYCIESQKKADSEKLLTILENLLDSFEKKNKLLNNKKSYKNGSKQTIQERITELEKDPKKNKSTIIDLYYEILYIAAK